MEGNLQMQFQSTRYAKPLELAYRYLTIASCVTIGVTEDELRGEHPTSTFTPAARGDDINTDHP